MENGSWAALAGKLHFLGFLSIQARRISMYLRALPSAIVREKRTDVYGKATDESDQGEEDRSALG
jgi:hypothetical protein